MPDTTFNTTVADAVVPEVFGPYVQLQTEQKSALIRSGALTQDPALDAFLAGPGKLVEVPKWKDLDDDADNISTDVTADHWGHELNGSAVEIAAALGALSDARPKALGSVQETCPRLNRNQLWAASDLTGELAGDDPMEAIGDRVSDYWVRRYQDIFKATVQGVIRDNAANDSGDYAYEPPGLGTYVQGVTDFKAEHALSATLTLGDSKGKITVMVVHSVVHHRMQVLDMIDFIPDSKADLGFGTFQGKTLLVDDGMPSGTNVIRKDGSAGVAGMYETWMFMPGAVRIGESPPKVPVAITREEQAGNGGGQEILFSRRQLCMHPTGHRYTGTVPATGGGPSNANTTNNLAHAGSWDRVAPERKMVGFCRLITQES